MTTSNTATKACTLCASSGPFYKSSRRADGLDSYCKSCRDKKNKETAQRCSFDRTRINREWRARNRDKARSIARAYWRKDVNKSRELSRLKYASNPERARLYTKRWREKNPDAVREMTMRYYAKKSRSFIPAWSDAKAVIAMYAEARRMSRETGIKHHVDHIVPLRSVLVCGLHAHTNLRVIPARLNQAKSNRIWPDMPEAA